LIITIVNSCLPRYARGCIGSSIIVAMAQQRTAQCMHTSTMLQIGMRGRSIVGLSDLRPRPGPSLRRYPRNRRALSGPWSIAVRKASNLVTHTTVSKIRQSTRAFFFSHDSIPGFATLGENVLCSWKFLPHDPESDGLHQFRSLVTSECTFPECEQASVVGKESVNARD
jgi:hypothetical protein